MLERPTRRDRFEFRGAQLLSTLPPRAQVRLSGTPAVTVDGQRLEPEIQLLMAMLARSGAPVLGDLPALEARAAVRRQALATQGRPVRVGSVRDLQIDGAAGPLRARHYAPPEGGGPHPLLVFLHGGGFVVGDLDTHDAPCRLLCRHAGIHVLSVDYRLAPEHPFPAAADDACAALTWALAHAEELGADPARVAVGGDSAGGNLAAVAAQGARDGGGPAPVLQLLLYPTVDGRLEHPSLDLFAEGFFLTRKGVDFFAEQYAGPEPDVTDPRLSPLLAPDLSGLAPAYVVTAGFDPLRDEGEAYAGGLRAAGTPTHLRRFPGLVHGFVSMTGVSRVSRDATIEIAGAVRALLAVTTDTQPRGAEVAVDVDATPTRAERFARPARTSIPA